MKTKVLLGVTGSVAATLTPKLVKQLQARGCEVKIVATEKSLYFWNPADVSCPVFREKDEWRGKRYRKGDRVLHIELRDWAEYLLIAPLSANTLAKLANGYCDNLLTSIARGWVNISNKRMVLAPAMNTYMWEHPVTSSQLWTVRKWFPGTILVEPVSKKLACGTTGVGAMADIKDIVDAVVEG